MDRELIPDEIKRFILTSIPSVPYLEAMLLLRSAPEQHWDARKVAQRLYMSEKSASDLLTELRLAGIACVDEQNGPACLYRPASPELRQMIEVLADTYARQLVAVSNLIHSKTTKRAHHFADAFKWRKDS